MCSRLQKIDDLRSRKFNAYERRRHGFEDRRSLRMPAVRSTVIRTTNLPFSEWTQVFPNVQRCKALLGRVAARVHKRQRGRCQREKREARLLNLPLGSAPVRSRTVVSYGEYSKI